MTPYISFTFVIPELSIVLIGYTTVREMLHLYIDLFVLMSKVANLFKLFYSKLLAKWNQKLAFHICFPLIFYKSASLFTRRIVFFKKGARTLSFVSTDIYRFKKIPL